PLEQTVSRRRIQELLRDTGFYSGPIDGIFGEGTRNAVINFQRRYNLQPDGIVGARTLAVLQEVAEADNPYVVVIPLRNPEMFNEVRQYVLDAEMRESRRGAYIAAGAFSNRSYAESESYRLRSLGFDARVAYF
ncbi:MAG: peptidoglycan-binding domain-containing protein, partial [Cyanobacteriota bacterium]